jgi:hypothetical protein
MVIEGIAGVAVAGAGAFAWARRRRALTYRTLADRLFLIRQTPAKELGLKERALPDFGNCLATSENFLPLPAFAALKSEVERLTRPERGFVPVQRKGGTVAYETLIKTAPEIVAYYHSVELMQFISRLTGVDVRPTPIHDQSSLSVLSYTAPGDHIGWHYDHNFYRGRHFTVLLSIANEGTAPDGSSHATLMARFAGQEAHIATLPNMLVVFEGARVRHKVTPICDGERRVILSMTYCADPRSHWWQGAPRRIKDTAFYGARALWT